MKKENKNNWEKLRKGYEEVQMVQSSIEKAYPEAYRLARKFHKLYEDQAPFFGYITNPNSREFYPNSNNGRLMAYVCYTIVEEEKNNPTTNAQCPLCNGKGEREIRARQEGGEIIDAEIVKCLCQTVCDSRLDK